MPRPLRKQLRANEVVHTLALTSGAPIAPLMRRPLAELAQSERRAPQRRRAPVPVESRIVLRSVRLY
jgi:hypothetical protein